MAFSTVLHSSAATATFISIKDTKLKFILLRNIYIYIYIREAELGIVLLPPAKFQFNIKQFVFS